LDLNELIREVLALTVRELSEHRIVLACELTKPIPHVLGDRVQLQQVLLSLIINGIEAMTGVTGRPRSLFVQSGGRSIKECPGGGTRLGHWPRLRYGSDVCSFLYNKAARYGAGLSISRSLIEAHGGRLWAEPNTPHGSVFCFSLPLVGENAP
jgi:signal transduction histidine kinase